MRMRGFLIGGILGATAAMVFSRNNRPMLLTKVNWDQAVDKAGQFIKSARSMWDATSVIGNRGGSNAKSTEVTSGKSSAGLDKVGKIVSEDAALQHQVNEIMKDSDTSQVHS